MTLSDIDEFLSLQMVRKNLRFSFKSLKELRGHVELLPKGPKWEFKTITYEGYPTKTPIVLYYRDPLECNKFLLRNPLLEDHIDLTPRRDFRNGRRIFGEWISSDGAWEMQAALPTRAALLGVIAMSDKTNISVMNGDRVAHPLLTSLANIQMNFLMKAANHAFMMTALIPVVNFLCHKDIRGLMERRLMHHCLDLVYASLKTAAAYGCKVSDTTGRVFEAYTPLAAYIVDTPEAADIACVMGKTSHLTTASHKTFGDSYWHEERTGANTWAQILHVNLTVNPWDIEKYQIESKKYRLSGVHLPFWRNWSLSLNPTRFLTPEPLHHLHKGFYDHDFQWCRRIVKDNEIDFQLSIIQPRIGFRHFKEGVTRLKQLGGREHRELEQCIIAVIADAAPRKVVHVIRALIDFRYLAQAPEIDKDTLLRMDAALQEFHEHKQHIIDAETNHRDYDPQIVQYLDRAEKMRVFDLTTGLKSSSIQLDLEFPDADLVSPDADHEDKDQALPIYPHLESRMFTNSSTAFCLNRTPSRSHISVDKAAQLFYLDDLRPALGDYFENLEWAYQRKSSDTPVIGGHRRSGPNCSLPFTHLDVWYSIRVQNRSPHRSSYRPLTAQTLQAQPPGEGEWAHGRCDTVLLCNDPRSAWPGEGFRGGLKGLTVAQIRLIM
ncbi:hypothetical protein C8J57DRAFT_1231631 [Mycena rebaudengoi]|nr:hypothetical protein C8J57DRAFT_1231631 [Mycena rebaudengoi]